MKKLTHGYLYATGHAVLCYEKHDKDCGTVEWCEIHQKWTDASLDFEGRLVFTRGSCPELMRMAKRAQRIRATKPSIDAGSENTRKAGLAIADLTLTFGDFSDYLNLTSLPGLLSAPWTYQPDVCEPVPSEYCAQWGTLRVSKVHVNAAVNEIIKAQNKAEPVAA